MKPLSERIESFMARKGLDRLAAIEWLLTFALDVLDARRKGGETRSSERWGKPKKEKRS